MHKTQSFQDRDNFYEVISLILVSPCGATMAGSEGQTFEIRDSRKLKNVLPKLFSSSVSMRLTL